MEADLARQGIDFLDLYRPGGGASHLTPRKLWVLLYHSPHNSWLRLVREEAEQAAQIPTADKIRARQAHYEGRSDG